MKISRDAALFVHFLFDECLPPILRESKWFMTIPLRMLFKHHYKVYFNFKDRAFQMTEEEFCNTYRTVSDTGVNRETDLNKASVSKIMEHVSGQKVLDVGCGRGFLAKLLAQKHQVTGLDIVVPERLRSQNPHIKWVESNVESMPFADKEFDTVVCTHTLEHVRNMYKAIHELRRVGKKLIIVVPRQRPYKYTFDLHLNFFPYLHSLLSVMGQTGKPIICEDVDGDIFYVEMPS